MMSEHLLKPRFIETILPASNSKRLVILTGARQTGKTTSAKRLYPGLNYISLDSPENRETLRLLSTGSWSKTIGAAILDEAQKEPVVFEKLKYAYDAGSVTFSVVLGSSQILLLKKVRESLAGRASIYEIWPLMMSEICQPFGSPDLRQPLIERLIVSKDIGKVLVDEPEVYLEEKDWVLRTAEEHLLRWGGMPGLLPLADEERWKWLKDYEYTYLERDLADLSRLDDLMPFRTLQKLAALRSGKLLNASEIARDAGISVDTARRYLEYLRISYQTILITPYFRNLTSTVIKTPKLYWLDIGLLRQLNGIRGELTGDIYETMVISEIVKWIKTAQRDVDIFFYRTRSGMELDLLLKTTNGFIGMEIKSRKLIRPTDWTSMKIVAERLGNEWLGGLIVNLGSQLRKVAEPNIWSVPSRRLLT
jgi:uncharacterized protein